MTDEEKAKVLDAMEERMMANYSLFNTSNRGCDEKKCSNGECPYDEVCDFIHETLMRVRVKRSEIKNRRKDVA